MNLCHEDTARRTLGHEYLKEGINFVSCAEAREMEKREKNLGKGRMLMMASVRFPEDTEVPAGICLKIYSSKC